MDFRTALSERLAAMKITKDSLNSFVTQHARRTNQKHIRTEISRPIVTLNRLYLRIL